MLGKLLAVLRDDPQEITAAFEDWKQRRARAGVSRAHIPNGQFNSLTSNPENFFGSLAKPIYTAASYRNDDFAHG